MDKETKILEFIKNHPSCSPMEIVKGLSEEYSLATIKRTLTALLDKGLVPQEGRARGTKYSVSATYKLFCPILVDSIH